jgi:hypothetical protein
MAPRAKTRDPHIVVTESDGTVTSLLIPRNRRINRNAITGLDQVVTAGDNAQRTDQRTPQVIKTDQSGGMGQFWDVETEGVTSYRISTCDTRYPNMICLPPLPTSLGNTGLVFNLPSYAEYLGVTNAYVLAWARRNASTTSARRNSTGTTWATITTGGTGISQLTQFAQFRGAYAFGTLNSTIGIYYSTDAVTWSNSAKAKAVSGICTHDNKIYAYNSTDNTLDWHDDLSAAHATWTTSSTTLRLWAGEYVSQLIEWRDRVGRAAVYVVTSQRLIQYDEDADAFLDFADYSDIVTATAGIPIAQTHLRDGNLYLGLYDPNVAGYPAVFWFSGTTNLASPNLRGGLATTEQISIQAIDGGRRWLYFFGPSTGSGKILAMNDQQQFSSVYTSTQGQLNGGGYRLGKAHALIWDGSANMFCDEVPLPDDDNTPLFASRTYAASAAHEYSLTDGGTPNMYKTALWVELQGFNHAQQIPGLAGTTQVIVKYALDTDTGWTTLGTLTNASTFPARLPFDATPPGGLRFKQIKFQLLLSTGTSSLTPIVTSFALAYVRAEVPRYAYTVPVTLEDRTHAFYRGKSIAGQMAAIDRWTQPGALVKLQIAGGDWATAPSKAITVNNCLVAYSGEIDPEKGPTNLMIQFSDYSTPSDG